MLGAVLLGAVTLAGCSDPELQTHKQWVRDLRADLAKVRSEVETSQARITALATELAAAQKEKQTFSDELDTATRALAEQRMEQAATASQLQNLHISLRALGRQAGIAAPAHSDPASLLAALAVAGEEREAQRKGALAAAARNAAQVVALTRARDYLEQRVKALSDVDSESAQVPGARIFRERERQLRSQLEALAAANQYLQRQARRLILERDVADAGIAQARQQTAALNQAKLYLQKQIGQLNGTAAAQAKRAADDLAVNLADALAQRDALQTEVAALQGDLRRLHKTSENLAVQFETARHSLHALRNQSAGNLEALRKAEQDAIALRGKFDAEDNRRRALRARVKELNTARQKAVAALNTALAKIERMQAMLDTAAAQQAKMRSGAEALDEANGRLRQMLDTAAAQVAQQSDMQTALAQSQESLTGAQAALAEAEQVHQQATAKMRAEHEAALQEATSQHTEALATLERELTRTKASLGAALRETQGARDAAQVTLAEVRGELSRLETTLKAANKTRDEALALSEQLAQRLTSNAKQIVDLQAANATLKEQLEKEQLENAPQDAPAGNSSAAPNSAGARPTGGLH